MAKKNKKISKINIKMRNFFGGDPFDVGIERVEEKTLAELAHTIGLYDVEFKKPELVRAFRQLYSTNDTAIRAEILDFFKANKKIYSRIHLKPEFEKEDKLNSILDEFNDITVDEKAELFSEFLNIRTRKITYTKIESKLKHLRFEKKKQEIQKALDGVFDIDDRFEFYGVIDIKFKEHSFKKITALKTNIIDIQKLQEQDIQSLIEQIKHLKEEKISSYQKQVDIFLDSLKNYNRYLSDDDIVKTLKSADNDLILPRPSDEILYKVFIKILNITSLHVDNDFITLSINETFEFFKKELNYDIYLQLDTQEILKKIYASQDLLLEDKADEINKEQQGQFLYEFESLVHECSKNATLLDYNIDEIRQNVYDILKAHIDNNLHITPKINRKVIYTFNKSIQQQLQKKQKQMLLARTIREFKDLFALARQLKRELIFHVGPTNSGKTYQAMKALKSADTGYYLAPLRLLALEGYEDLCSSGLEASLITGEEQILDEDATHISSTIEMLNFDADVDVCVIDEVQMINDEDRGWAWANAIIGAPAKKVIMTGSANALEAVRELADYLGEKLTIINFERKNPLRLHVKATAIDEIEPGTAIVAFSRKDVLRLKQKFSKEFKISVVYGNLSPEVRREEAKRFREKQTDILIATDAIAMGLNLPIKTILFYKVTKYDGRVQRVLSPSEVQQIAGRAGRYNMQDVGYVGAFKNDALHVIANGLNQKAEDIAMPFKVMANLDHIKLAGSILGENSLADILEFFVKNMQFNGPFRAANIETMLEAAKIVDSYDLDIATKYHLSCAPLTLKSPYIVASFERYVSLIEQKMTIEYIPPHIQGQYAKSMEELLMAEDMVKEISLYLWLSYRFDEFFIDTKSARHFRLVLNRYIEKSLQQSHFVPRCKICSKVLPLDSKYQICQSCFRKNYRRR